MHDFLELLERKPRWVTWLLAASLTLLFAWFNLRIGWEISFSILYLLPIGVAAWVLGRLPGALFALLSTLAWWHANQDFPTLRPLVLYWNSFVRFLLFVIVAELIVDLRTALQRERDLARTDPLTGLANTRSFTELAQSEIARARRTGRPLALACIDLDGFKQINDDLGHAAGDEMLRLVGHALRASTRSSDLPARLGGDEFAILLPETDAVGAQVILQKVVANVTSYAVVGERSAKLSAAAVVSLSAPRTVDDLLRAADRLMYEVKRERAGDLRVEKI